jgi:hypothetical protein
MNSDTIHAPLPFLVRDAESERSVEVSGPWNLFGLLILLSAFLLFQTELILAKYILPWFGGTPAVWNTCMLFYQSVLLAGYGYSHWLCSRFAEKKQARIHFGVVAISSVALALTVVLWGSPLTPAPHWKYWLAANPVLHIVGLLTLAIGIPFFLLSTTGPLLQHWYSQLYPKLSPYRLYAVSNLGSLLGLLGYPFLLEWLLPIKKQALLWTILFVVFLALYAVQNWAVGRHVFASEGSDRPASAGRIGTSRIALWIGLSACASVMLLATTNQVCQNISSNPFLWVLPLCIYLLSFTICFENSRWYRRSVFFGLYFISVWLTTRMMATPQDDLDPVRQLSVYFVLLFSVCMVCNGELERLKPSRDRVTPFYLSIALGGALGGAFVVLVAPRVFHNFYEFHLAVLVTGGLVLAVSLVEWTRALRAGRDAWRRPSVLGRLASALAALAAMALLGFALRASVRREVGNVVQVRNFFGAKRVYDENGTRYLQDGPILHGGQALAEPLQMQPLLYYTQHTGLGVLLTNYRRITARSESAALRVGVIGLGAGSLAAYARNGDYMRFYEIDPQIVELAAGSGSVFTYVHKSPGRIETVLGDARLSLESEASRHEFQQFDVLVLDAFGGDAIPVHLLTSEAMQLYLQHLRGPDSVIAVHISNRVVDLTPVLRAASSKWQLTFNHFGSFGGVDWVLLSRNPKILQDPALYRPFDWSKDPPVLWTDDYSNLLSVLKR